MASDIRLEPRPTWSVIREARYEPSRAGGGAIVLELAPGTPEPVVTNPDFTRRGQDASIDGQTLRPTLGDLAYTPDAVRSALADFAQRRTSRESS